MRNRYVVVSHDIMTLSALTVLTVLCAGVTSAVPVRLTGGVLPYEGRLEVYYNGTWGTVCGDFFDNVDATVACKSLGYGFIGQNLGKKYGAGTGQIWLDDLQCVGSETDIDNCRHGAWGLHNCGHNEDVSIACYPNLPTNGSCGRQFACADGECIPRMYYCNGFIDCADKSDELYCLCNVRRQFQCDDGKCISRFYVCDGYRSCSDGSDERDCPCGRNQFRCGSGTCISLTAKCNGRRDCEDGSDESNCTETTKLSPTTTTQPTTTTVKTTTLSSTTTTEPTTTTAKTTTTRATTTTTAKTTKVSSTTTPEPTTTTAKTTTTRETTTAAETTTVSLTTTPESISVAVRLADSGVWFEGRLEVYYNGVWGTVCDDSFDDIDATVACKSVGSGLIGHTLGNRYGPGTGRIWLDDLLCTGSETNVGYCRHRGWGSHDCGHHEDISIACSRSVRLVGSALPYEGRLEVYYNGVWGTVCSDYFSNVDAKVACKSFGTGLIGQTLGYRYGPGTGRIWLDNLHCRGSEVNIGRCRHNRWGSHNCRHSKDISIACYRRVRLTGVGSMPYEGRLEVYYNGNWGTVCDDYFDHVDAAVACKSLGSGLTEYYSADTYLSGTGRIWLDNLQCTGSETFIGNCRHLGWGVHNCYHSEDVYIGCYPRLPIKVCGRRSPNIRNVGPYIVNGQRAARGAWPWQVMLIIRLNANTTGRCGGVVLNDRWILTAAHCVVLFGEKVNASKLQVRLGGILATDADPDAVYANVLRVIPHIYYNNITNLNDIALLRLTRPVKYTDTILPVCLPSFNISLNQFRVCVNTGFGRTSYNGSASSHLMQVRMNILSFYNCQRRPYGYIINDDAHVCISPVSTSNSGPCMGDSGGPFVCRDQQGTWILVGINSFGRIGCTQSVVTRVSTYFDWIHLIMTHLP